MDNLEWIEITTYFELKALEHHFLILIFLSYEIDGLGIHPQEDLAKLVKKS
jgi:hypothetical protein